MQVYNNINSSWSEKVMPRINGVYDLPDANTVNHKICSRKFRTGKWVPIVFALGAVEQNEED